MDYLYRCLTSVKLVTSLLVSWVLVYGV